MEQPLQMQQMQPVTGVRIFLAEDDAVWVALYDWSVAFIGRTIGEWAYVGRVYA